MIVLLYIHSDLWRALESWKCAPVSGSPLSFVLSPFSHAPLMHTSVPRSWGLLRLLAKSWYPRKLTTYLMQHTLIATSERFFIRYCAAPQRVPSLARNSREKTLQQSCRGSATARDGLRCNNNSSTAHLTSEHPHLLPFTERPGPRHAIHKSRSRWMVGKEAAHAVKKRKINATPSAFFLF